jgi:hypothetical protein
MQSITSSEEFLALPETMLPEPTDSGPSDIAHGLQVLTLMVGGIQKPPGLSDEMAALEALRAIHLEHSLSVEENALLEELDRSVQLVEGLECQHLVDWITQPESLLQKFHPVERHRPQRLLLLLVLLAETIGRVSDYRIPTELQEAMADSNQGAAPHLSWLPRLFLNRKYLPVCEEYLAAYLVIFFEGRLHSPDSLTPEEFNSWPWYSRMLHLQGWRLIWQRRHEHNPATCSGRLEFTLARRGAYGALERQGGLLARRAISRLGYADTSEGKPPLRARQFLPALLLALGAVAAWFAVDITARDLVSHHSALEQELRSALNQEEQHD